MLHAKGRAPKWLRERRLGRAENFAKNHVAENVPDEISRRNFTSLAASAYSNSKKALLNTRARLHKSWNVSYAKWRVRILDLLQMLRLPVRKSGQEAIPDTELTRAELKEKLMRAYFTKFQLRSSVWLQVRKHLGLSINYRVRHTAARKMAEQKLKEINELKRAYGF